MASSTLRVGISLTLCLLLVGWQTAYAQKRRTSDQVPLATKVKFYQAQMRSLSAGAKLLAAKIERQNGGPSSEQEGQKLRLEIAALAAQTAALMLQAAEADLSGEAGRNKEVRRGLLLLGQAGTALDFVLDALKNYVNTRDEVFLNLARQGDELVQAAEKSW